MPSRTAIAVRWLRRSWPGRLLLAGVLLRALSALAGLVVSPLPWPLAALGTLGSLLLIVVGGYLLARVAVWAKRRLLWRVRRKLILSYVFIGFVPGLLIVLFFLLSGLLLFFNVSAYLVQARLANLADQARFLAQSTMLELQRSTTADAVRETLERRQASTEARYPFVSTAVVPVGHLRCEAQPSRRVRLAQTLPVPLPLSAGPWGHLDAPASVPEWVTCAGFAGLMAYDSTGPVDRDGDGGDSGGVRLVVRAVAVPDMADPRWAVVLDLPLSAEVERRLAEETGIRLGEISAVGFGTDMPSLGPGRALEPRPRLEADESSIAELGGRWVAFLEYHDWTTGRSGQASAQIALNVWDIYTRLSTISPAQFGSLSFSQVLLFLLAVVGILFLIIQFVALVLGLLLARQITGAVHDLFTGTQHLRNRDFTHEIPVRARDQLGELAESFNLMTGEVTTLLREMAEKGRMEQEMLAAREIQQRCCRAAPLSVPGLAVNAFCEPAREVAGDYYDFLPITDTMVGVLIADVSGKGLAAGLYMAQLKVIVQSLARVHHEPREFLIAVNRSSPATSTSAASSPWPTRHRPRAPHDDRGARRALPAAPRAGRGARRPAQGASSSHPTASCSACRSTTARCSRHAAGDDRAARARRRDRALHRRHQRDDERGVRLLRRGAAGHADRAVRAPAVRSAALLHLGRAEGVRRRRRPARRHDHDPAARG
jgi:HAMP domain-containing protein